MRSKDLDTRKPYTTRPPSTEVVSCSRRGDKFLKDWITSDDRPCRGDDGRLFIILPDADVPTVLRDAARAGLNF
jgi:hypothetical protein